MSGHSRSDYDFDFDLLADEVILISNHFETGAF